jgi:hypothetical protein
MINLSFFCTNKCFHELNLFIFIFHDINVFENIYPTIKLFMNHLAAIDDVVSAASSSVPTPADIDSTWVLVTSFSALLAILGFAFIGSGAVRYKSVQSAVITVFLGSVVALVFFWLVIIILS